MRLGLALLALLGACSSSDRPSIRVFADEAAHPVLTRFVSLVPYRDLELVESDDPLTAAAASGGIAVAVLADQSCRECYRIEQIEEAFVVRGDAPLGVQYGLARFFEELGFRFFHPWQTSAPKSPRAELDPAALGQTFEPEIETRGLHLHTLHPIDPYYAFWEPGEDSADEAVRILADAARGDGSALPDPPGRARVGQREPQLRRVLR